MPRQNDIRPGERDATSLGGCRKIEAGVNSAPAISTEALLGQDNRMLAGIDVSRTGTIIHPGRLPR